MRNGIRGASDILCVQGPMGRFVGIEVKRELGGRVSADQEKWGQAVESAGGLYIVARDVEAVARGLGPDTARVMKLTRQRVIPR